MSSLLSSATNIIVKKASQIIHTGLSCVEERATKNLSHSCPALRCLAKEDQFCQLCGSDNKFTFDDEECIIIEKNVNTK
jgi:hypothetical protein